jgi:uncharacterized protein (TIGR02453 family)
VAFTGWPVEAVEFYEGLEADNTKAYWQEHKAVYEQCVKAPMEALLADLAEEFGGGRVFRPYRDTRFSKDKTPYKLSCDAHLPGGYLSLSADELFVGSGLYMPDSEHLQRYRTAVAADSSGEALESIVTDLRNGGYEVGAHQTLKTAPKGFPKGPSPHRAPEAQGHRDVEVVAGRRLARDGEGQGPCRRRAGGSTTATELDRPSRRLTRRRRRGSSCRVCSIVLRPVRGRIDASRRSAERRS